MYRVTNGKIERASQVLTHFMLANTVIMMLLPLVFSVVNIYFLDAGEESYFVFFSTWLVFTMKVIVAHIYLW